MIRIGICDDNQPDRDYVHRCCEEYFSERETEHEYLFFESGEEVLSYCEKEDKDRIHLLFLDVEMSGVSGIEVKDSIIHNEEIWRIVFVSSHKENVFDSFGIKTIGFVAKPYGQQEIHKWINVVLQNIKENILIKLEGADSPQKEYVHREDLLYLKAAGNYVEAYVRNPRKSDISYILLSQKLNYRDNDSKRGKANLFV